MQKLQFRYAAMAQMVEHILGKDEVTGSNPVSSSSPHSGRMRIFLLGSQYLKYDNDLGGIYGQNQRTRASFCR